MSEIQLRSDNYHIVNKVLKSHLWPLTILYVKDLKEDHLICWKKLGYSIKRICQYSSQVSSLFFSNWMLWSSQLDLRCCCHVETAYGQGRNIEVCSLREVISPPSHRLLPTDRCMLWRKPKDVVVYIKVWFISFIQVKLSCIILSLKVTQWVKCPIRKLLKNCKV